MDPTITLVIDVAARVRALRSSGDASVVSAWVVSRVIVALGLTIGYSWRTGVASDGGFLVWDGRWYGRIAIIGYGGPPRAGAQTPWPFFPVLPGLLRVARWAALPDVLVVVIANHALVVVALLGVRRLADRHFGREVACCSVWVLAAFPMSAVFSMVYPSAIFLAAAVWAFEFGEQRRWWCSGLAACVATMVRPNGLVVALVLAVVTLSVEPAARRMSIVARQAAPSAAAITAWIAICLRRTGNPVVFITAKSAWHEVTLIGLAGRLVDDLHFDSTTIHVGLGIIAAAALWAVWDRLPVAWRLLAVISLAVPLATGLVGLGRYTNECFPVAIAGGVLLAGLPKRARAITLTTSTIGAFAIAVDIASHRLVP